MIFFLFGALLVDYSILTKALSIFGNKKTCIAINTIIFID